MSIIETNQTNKIKQICDIKMYRMKKAAIPWKDPFQGLKIVKQL